MRPCRLGLAEGKARHLQHAADFRLFGFPTPARPPFRRMLDGRAEPRRSFVVIMKDGKIYKNTLGN